MKKLEWIHKFPSLVLIPGFPLFSSQEIPWLFQFFWQFSLTFFQDFKTQTIYSFKWVYHNKKLKLNCIKMLLLFLVFSDDTHFVSVWNQFLTKKRQEITVFVPLQLIFYYLLIKFSPTFLWLLAEILKFLDFSLTGKYQAKSAENQMCVCGGGGGIKVVQIYRKTHFGFKIFESINFLKKFYTWFWNIS